MRDRSTELLEHKFYICNIKLQILWYMSDYSAFAIRRPPEIQS